MPLIAGTRLGPYEIHSPIGAGGMGEVYKARDTRLNRTVAIKVLPALLASDPQFRERFDREARAISQLSHPHICTLYDVGEADAEMSGGGRDFSPAGPVSYLVMEYLEGESLADRLKRGPVPIGEAVALAKQIAEALEAAHEKGIIHRDLKPANIKVTPDGTAKVLDFGLAKDLAGAPVPLDLAMSPTFASPATQVGLVLGTAAYMSPEQARGRAVDKRADIWAFGCVLFEMLTGRQAFPGDDVTEVLAKVIERDPDWTALPASMPAPVRRLLARCFAKDPRLRLRDIGEARFTMDEALGARDESPTLTIGSPSPTPSRGRVRQVLPWTIAAVLGLVALAAVAWAWRGQAPFGQTIRVELTLPADVEFFSSPSVSADGARVAFVGVREGVRQVYVRKLDGSETQPLPGTEGASVLSLSPDGRWVAFVILGNRLKRVSLETGVVEAVAAPADFVAGVAWGHDGSLVFGRAGRLMTVPAGGGEPQELTTLDQAGGETIQEWPVVSADGAAVLFTSRRERAGISQLRIEAISLRDRTRHVVVDGATNAVYVSADRLVFLRDDALFVARFDPARLALTESPSKVSDEVLLNPLGNAAAAVAESGSFLFASSRVFRGRLIWVSTDGVERPVGGPPRGYRSARVSPDGRLIAFSDVVGGMWTLDPAREAVTRVAAAAGGNSGFFAWSPDGRRLIYRTPNGIAWQSADGEGKAEPLAGSGPNDYPASVSPDGSALAVVRLSPETAADIYVLPLRGSAPARPVLATPAYEGGAQFSPDGRWLAYTSDESGRMEVYLRPFPGPDRRWPVSTGGGLHPLWSPDGRRIFYRAGQGLMAVDVATSPDVRLGTPTRLFERRYEFGPNLSIPNYSISHDGRQLLMVRQEAGGGHLNLVVNWLSPKAR